MQRFVVLALLVSSLAAHAQTVAPPRAVHGVGQATLTAKPDLAKVTVGVVTQATSAQDAATRNASATTNVIGALQQVLGQNADIQTVAYSLSPNYQHPTNGGPAILSGYTASNTLLVSMSDLSIIGKVIDAANQAGSNSIGGLMFTLKDDEPLRQQALTAAATQARAHAQAIASGLNLHLGAVLQAQEGSTVMPVYANALTVGATTTPIQPGLVQVQATVTADFEIVQ